MLLGPLRLRAFWEAVMYWCISIILRSVWTPVYLGYWVGETAFFSYVANLCKEISKKTENWKPPEPCRDHVSFSRMRFEFESIKSIRSHRLWLIVFQVAKFFVECNYLSNQYPWSIHCRKTSIGGWAPYFSLAGMLRSSTNTTTFLPIGGPYTPRLRLQGNAWSETCETPSYNRSF